MVKHNKRELKNIRIEVREFENIIIKVKNGARKIKLSENISERKVKVLSEFKTGR